MSVEHSKRREYRAAYIRKHYQENKQYYREKAEQRQAKIKLYIRALKDNPCTDCLLKYPYYVMHFDHKFDKKLDLSRAANQGWSLQRVDEEVAKCDLVCANCHAERTHQRRITEVQLRSKE